MTLYYFTITINQIAVIGPYLPPTCIVIENRVDRSRVLISINGAVSNHWFFFFGIGPKKNIDLIMQFYYVRLILYNFINS